MTRRSTVAALLLATPVLAACTENAASDPEEPGTIAVTSTDDACELSADEAPAGTVAFDVTNEGSRVTEFYLLGEDGLRIVGEVENVGPNLTRQLVVVAPPGDYVTACKPGMKGRGIRAPFTVTESDQAVAVTADDRELVREATGDYAAYVHGQAEQLLVKTRRFASLYAAGQDDAARALYPLARTHWERIETVAESFGDLDPKLDAREVDLEPGQRWTGWHRIEKDLWPERAPGYRPLDQRQRATFARDLVAHTRVLHRRLEGMRFSVDQIANGSRGLLEEVATGKITGEEEYWSRTDLWDFQANVDGARVAFEGLEPLVQTKDPRLAQTLDTRFEQLQSLLDAQRTDDGFRSYDQLRRAQVKELADAVNALSEALSRLTAAVVA